MANRMIDEVRIDSDRFRVLLAEKNVSIRKLGMIPEIGVDEKTIRRNLKYGRMRLSLIRRIEAVLGIEEGLFYEKSPLKDTQSYYILKNAILRCEENSHKMLLDRFCISESEYQMIMGNRE